jgi:hypothetical protein
VRDLKTYLINYNSRISTLNRNSISTDLILLELSPKLKDCHKNYHKCKRNTREKDNKISLLNLKKIIFKGSFRTFKDLQDQKIFFKNKINKLILNLLSLIKKGKSISLSIKYKN